MRITTKILLLFSAFISSISPSFAGSEPIPLSIKPSVNENELGRKESFSITFENPNDKPVYCKNVYMQAYIGPVTNPSECLERYFELVTLDMGSFELGAKGDSSAQWTSENSLGGEELTRFRLNRTDGANIEYCARSTPAYRCGFNCEGGRKYDEDWDVEIPGGAKKYRCESTGEIKRTSDPVSCQEGYSTDFGNDRCLKLCPDGHQAGDTWSKTIENGTVNYTCNTEGTIVPAVFCTEPTRFAPSGESCVPASCPGGVSHGSRGNSVEIFGGWQTSLCQFGGWTETIVECDGNHIKENGSCRDPRPCGNYAHDQTFSASGNCSRTTCKKTVTTSRCSDGNISTIGSHMTSCTPPGQSTCIRSD